MEKSIFLALDFPTWQETKDFLNFHELYGVPVKVGMELFYREGPKVIESLKANNHPIFLDLKLHDIPTTVMRAMRNLSSLGVDIVNVHALGGSEMIKRAKEGLSGGQFDTKLIAVTVLTSMDTETLNVELMIPGNTEDVAVHFADFAKRNGADGVVCSVHESMQIKEKCGMDFLTVTPGIRLEDSSRDDQKRIASPSYAVENGADFLVIGRSVTKAKHPREAYERALKECGVK
ncbi:orotidine-5'-phosphate decarboxylase [Oceanobacillus bengalensis]|uniref:Orotidine 5'-phosphate decarboxylase n=1 Tax=Oceanobacillus bengalensis TaxID=1435466 RepID=A0A494Z1P0_9BACI|nr:orotidine-5'-phosphate decarboxylase [Oceanobacillus bengalensis]RKQ16395.1 orotidine-5'-phosphate decarboxylase [Oceanobacillus bengalensis]